MPCKHLAEGAIPSRSMIGRSSSGRSAPLRRARIVGWAAAASRPRASSLGFALRRPDWAGRIESRRPDDNAPEAQLDERQTSDLVAESSNLSRGSLHRKLNRRSSRLLIGRTGFESLTVHGTLG